MRVGLLLFLFLVSCDSIPRLDKNIGKNCIINPPMVMTDKNIVKGTSTLEPFKTLEDAKSSMDSMFQSSQYTIYLFQEPLEVKIKMKYLSYTISSNYEYYIVEAKKNGKSYILRERRFKDGNIECD